MYSFGDVMHVSGMSIAVNREGNNSLITTTVFNPPPNKKICTVLGCDLTRVIIQYDRADHIPFCLIGCSGCTGSIRLEHSEKINEELRGLLGEVSGEDSLVGLEPIVSEFPFFQHINRSVAEVLGYFKLRSYDKDSIILRKDEPGRNLYLIVAGSVDVYNKSGIPFATLGPGDVFGEMSLFSDDTVSATVRTRESVEILFINGADFNTVVHRNPNLHLYFTRLLARRLQQANVLRSDDYASGMIGKLSEIPPEALFQTLHVNKKTGILTINEVPDGTARFSIRQGALIKARYGELSGEDAFYAILSQKSGRFRFVPGLADDELKVPEIGYFMKLLMEGLRRMDEERSRAARRGAEEVNGQEA